jgi:hypothetical protein
MFEFIIKKIADIKILHEGYTADYFLNRMKSNALFPILFIQNIYSGTRLERTRLITNARI